MKVEIKEIKWYHYPDEVPQCEAAEVLVKAQSPAAERMGYFTMMWFMSKNHAFRFGFVYDGEPLAKMRRDEYYPFREFEWCYLAVDDKENDILKPIF